MEEKSGGEGGWPLRPSSGRSSCNALCRPTSDACGRTRARKSRARNIETSRRRTPLARPSAEGLEAVRLRRGHTERRRRHTLLHVRFSSRERGRVKTPASDVKSGQTMARSTVASKGLGLSSSATEHPSCASASQCRAGQSSSLASPETRRPPTDDWSLKERRAAVPHRPGLWQERIEATRVRATALDGKKTICRSPRQSKRHFKRVFVGGGGALSAN